MVPETHHCNVHEFFGTYGNEDVYVSFRQSETWSSPLNLGPQVNSFAQEQTPYLSDNLQTLYFSSNVQGNGRGKDIYFAQRKSESWEDWTQPQKISLANSIGSELSYTIIDQTNGMAIFTTTQNSEGFGDFMMVKFESKEPLMTMEIVEEMATSAFENISSNQEDSVVLLVENEKEVVQELSQWKVKWLFQVSGSV